MTLEKWGGHLRTRNKKTGREVGSEKVEEVRGALNLNCHIGLGCWAAGSVSGEGLYPFSVNLVSTMTWKWGLTGASEAGDSLQRPLGGDGTLNGGEEEGKAPSH